MPGHPASACTTLLPEPAVRPAVALQAVSPMGMIVPAVPGYCSTCARAAPASRSSTAAAHHRIFRIDTPPILGKGTQPPVPRQWGAAPPATRPLRPESLDLPAPSCRVPAPCRSSPETSAAPRRSSRSRRSARLRDPRAGPRSSCWRAADSTAASTLAWGPWAALSRRNWDGPFRGTPRSGSRGPCLAAARTPPTFPGSSTSAPWALIGAGTGLGEAIAVLDACGRREVLATEGGHSSFAPRDEMEIGILRFLLRRYEHVSWERVVSGDGLVNIAEALAHESGAPLPPHVAQAALYARGDAPAAISAAARGGAPLCRRAVETFCTLYGAEAGNLALKALSTGGVYVAGGIAPKILPELRDGRFRAAFLAKGRMRPVLEAIPVQVVLDPNTTVLGAAALAADEATLLPQTRHTPATIP